MWVKDLVKLMLLLQLFILSSSLRSSALQVNNNGASGLVDIDSESLPNIWEDESVNRMVREMLARDLFREHDHRRIRRQYKRDIHSSGASSSDMTSATVSARAATKTTKRASVTQKTKKPSKVTQTGNKNKNRVTTTTKGTKATVKPSTKPIVTTTTAATTFGSVNASSKIKVRK
jgi:hypothetical protein